MMIVFSTYLSDQVQCAVIVEYTFERVDELKIEVLLFCGGSK